MRKSVAAMTVKEFLLRLARRVPPANRAAQNLLRKRLASPGGIERMNRSYLRLKGDESAMFHALFAKSFTDNEPEIEDTVWEVEFAGRRIKLPIRNGKLWLDWDNAVSITGHDPEIKRTYENILRSEYKPTVFFDVGANYGTHSLLFLTHGVQSVAFEPNPNCRLEFMNTCKLNDVIGDLVPVAVGERPDEAEFWFPLRETWLGSMVESTREAMVRDHKVHKINVRIITLDEFVASSEMRPDLIKIDTEGNEINVLRGARRTIAGCRPMIIFEANLLSDRSELWSEFEGLDYAIVELPFDFVSHRRLDNSGFVGSDQVNFIALPSEHPSLD
jgi:FkbM family methyltransferase